MDPTMTTPPKLVVPQYEGYDIEITIPTGPHYYTQTTWVGSVKTGVTAAAAFEALRSNSTPFQNGVRINETGDVTDIPGLGSVQHIVDAERMTIVNTTMDGHILHPGNVFRQIIQEGDNIFVRTSGYGVGILPDINNSLGPSLWQSVDVGIRNQLNSSTSTSSSAESWLSYLGAFALTNAADVREAGGDVREAVLANVFDAANAYALLNPLSPTAPTVSNPLDLVGGTQAGGGGESPSVLQLSSNADGVWSTWRISFGDNSTTPVQITNVTGPDARQNWNLTFTSDGSATFVDRFGNSVDFSAGQLNGVSLV